MGSDFTNRPLCGCTCLCFLYCGRSILLMLKVEQRCRGCTRKPIIPGPSPDHHPQGFKHHRVHMKQRGQITSSILGQKQQSIAIRSSAARSKGNFTNYKHEVQFPCNEEYYSACGDSRVMSRNKVAVMTMWSCERSAFLF